MNSLIKTVPNVKKFNDYLFELNKGTTPIMLSGLTDVGKIHMAYATKFYSEKPICIITYNEMQAKKIIKDLDFFGEKVRFFPKREYEFYSVTKEGEVISSFLGLFKRKAKKDLYYFEDHPWEDDSIIGEDNAIFNWWWYDYEDKLVEYDFSTTN